MPPDFLQQFPFITDVPLIIAAFWLVMTGRIVPRKTVDALLAARDAQVADWKAAYQNRDEAFAELIAQNDKLLESNQVTQYLLEDLVSRAKPEAP